MQPFTSSWVETFVDLHSAATVEQLWSVLLGWHGIRGSAAWDEPYLLFRKFHRDEPTDAEVTAALLCTDHRWRNASHRLIDHLAEPGLLSAAQLDMLADWFTRDAFEIEVATEARVRRMGPGDKTISTSRRPIWPPLRRWAARHQVERRPERWRDVIEGGSTLPSRDSTAIVAGVMDAAEHVAPSHLPTLVSIGTGHGSGVVRLAALPVLAKTEGLDAAMAQARSDRSAKVRAWKPQPPRTPQRDDDVPSEAESSPPSDGRPTLFD